MRAREIKVIPRLVMFESSFKLHLFWSGYRIVEKRLEIGTEKGVPLYGVSEAFSTGKSLKLSSSGI